MRISLCVVTVNPTIILAIQLMDGIGAGTFGVAITLMSADLTRGKQGFNTLLGILQAAVSFGGVVGPVVEGVIVEHFGFRVAFVFFAAVAALAALLFLVKVHETSGISTRMVTRK